MILELDDIVNFNIQTAGVSKTTSLTFSGLAFHSSLGVDQITNKVSGTEMLILVSLAPANTKRTGRFTYTVEIPEEVTKITWGQNKKIVWQR